MRDLRATGSGKSTFIRCINRPEEHDAGRIVIDAFELCARKYKMVFQQSNLFPHLTVLENLMIGPMPVSTGMG